MPLESFKTQYQQLQNTLQQRFLDNPNNIETLINERSQGVDKLLSDIYTKLQIDDKLCLVAVGGYGREELHLYSDIDLLILIPDGAHQQYQHDIAKFLTFLWDIGLEVGHAARDISDCVVEIQNLSVVTNLLESRFLFGKKALFTQMKSMIKTSNWSSQSFLIGKQKEQHNRHLNYADTAYSLEPNLKESPGGLRDIQTVFWVAKWYFNVNTMRDLVAESYLSADEYGLLKHAQLFLWKLRFALHIITNRREDKIAFQYQNQLSAMLGYVDNKVMAVEQLMKDYYQTVTKVSRLNDILLQLLKDRVLHTQNLNARFLISYGYIQANNLQIFKKQPMAFIEIFLLIAKHNYIHGIGVSTLRQMQADIEVIDENYYKKRQNNSLFIELLQQKQGINKALKLMNRYGILERYIPVFGNIMGLMQYDLFHAYTVDQHTLFVIRNLRRFFVDEFSKEFELCSSIAKTIAKPEILLLAGLFHDIAKGRGGDHAQLGAVDAQVFCKHHQLKTGDTTLVSDLVMQHLLMSQTVQKQDLEDFEVIEKFCQTVKTVQFLEFLYLLTVADIRATRDDLWNDWKDSLLKKLFYKAKTYLLTDSNTKPVNKSQAVEKIKQTVTVGMCTQGYDNESVLQVLDTLPKDYFLRYEIDEICWQLAQVMKLNDKNINISSRVSEQNVVDIFIYGDDSKDLFFKLVSIIEKLGLNIVDAKILTSKNHKAYNTISVLQDNLLQQINLNQVIENEFDKTDTSLQKTSAKLVYRHFEHNKIDIVFTHNKKWNLTKIEINMVDKQGLLSAIAYIFHQLNIDLVNARVATMGARVEDIFFVSNANKQPLSKAEQQVLKQTLREKL